MAVVLAQTDAEIESCWPVMVQLRPHLKREEFVQKVRGQFKEGYQLACICHQDQVAAVAGFRLMHNLIWDRFLYVDDLVTDQQTRSKGLGAELLKWLSQHAQSLGCTRLELDSGVQRFAAHRFYLGQRMFISCHHFSLELNEGK